MRSSDVNRGHGSGCAVCFELGRFVQYLARDHRGNLATIGHGDYESEPIVGAPVNANLHLAFERSHLAIARDGDGKTKDAQRLLILLVEWL